MPHCIKLLTTLALIATPLTALAKDPHAVRYVTFKSLHETPLTVAGRMMLPEGRRDVPFVVVLHGSSGPSLREDGYQAALADAGIGSLSLDEWTARGIVGLKDRPNTVMETLPDVYGARRWLINEMGTSPDQIGVMGFSFGGVASMLSATTRYSAPNSHDGGNFAASMPVYPVCWVYGTVEGYSFSDLDDIPVQIVTGGADGYDDDPNTCPTLVSKLTNEEQQNVEVHVLEGANHSFDKPDSNRQVIDPYGHRGAGGEVTMLYDAQATRRSHELAVSFFSRELRDE